MIFSLHFQIRKCEKLLWNCHTLIHWIFALLLIKKNHNFILLRSFLSHLTGGKYLIAGGYVRCVHGPCPACCPAFVDKITEVVEMIKTNSTSSFGLLPDKRIEAVGGVLGNLPIICGGRDFNFF